MLILAVDIVISMSLDRMNIFSTLILTSQECVYAYEHPLLPVTESTIFIKFLEQRATQKRVTKRQYVGDNGVSSSTYMTEISYGYFREKHQPIEYLGYFLII